jgi:hypothetical protein
MASALRLIRPDDNRLDHLGRPKVEIQEAASANLQKYAREIGVNFKTLLGYRTTACACLQSLVGQTITRSPSASRRSLTASSCMRPVQRAIADRENLDLTEQARLLGSEFLNGQDALITQRGELRNLLGDRRTGHRLLAPAADRCLDRVTQLLKLAHLSAGEDH